MKWKGFSILLVFGSYAGFYIRPDRICLGWVALSYLVYDIEAVLEDLMADSKKLRGVAD